MAEDSVPAVTALVALPSRRADHCSFVPGLPSAPGRPRRSRFAHRSSVRSPNEFGCCRPADPLLEVRPDEQQPEIPPRTQTRAAQPRRVEHRAQPLHKGIESGLLQDPVQPFEKGMSRARRKVRCGHPHRRRLSRRRLLAHCHAAKSTPLRRLRSTPIYRLLPQAAREPGNRPPDRKGRRGQGESPPEPRRPPLFNLDTTRRTLRHPRGPVQSSPRPAVRDAPGAHGPPVAAVARHPSAAVPGETVVAVATPPLPQIR